MTNEEALAIVDQATGALNANRENHIRIANAVNVLRALVEAEAKREKPKVDA